MDNKNRQPAKLNGNKKFVAVFIFTLILVLSVAQIACSPDKPAVGNTAGNNQTISNEQGRTSPEKQKAFFKIALLPDRSGSVDSTRTPLITMEQLDELIAFLCKHSGEIAFGLIDDDSNQPFARLRIDPQPDAPTTTAQKNNPYEQEKLINQYKDEMRRYKSREQQWRTEIDRRVEAFKDAVQPMIDCLHNQKCRSHTTDVAEGLKRADLFLSEKEAATLKSTILLLITDGLETVKPNSAPPTLKSRPRIILVNGSASLGILKDYEVEAVEGIDAAIRRIVQMQPEPDPAAVQLTAVSDKDGRR